MPIEFLDLLAPLDAGWVPSSLDAGDAARWSEGGALADAPVDVAATFAGAAWRSTAIDASFDLTGVRLRGGFTVPRHHHDRALLLQVFGGTLTIRSREVEALGGPGEDEVVELRAGQFSVIEAGTVCSLTAGSDGVTYLTSWPLREPQGATTWYPDAAWVERTAEGES